MPRDRRWDHLYDVEKRPVKAVLVERFAADLADELRALDPAPPDAVLRLALELARLDLAREWDEVERRFAEERERLGGEGAATARTLGRELVERCLALKDRADAARLTRADLDGALRELERRAFRVTLG